MLFSVLAATWQHFPIRSVLLPFFGGAALAFLPIFLTRWMATLVWKKLPFADKESVWTISEEELNSEIDGLRTSFGWEKIVKVKEEKNGLLLFTGPLLAHWLPQHGFSSVEELEEFRALVRKKGIEYRT